MNPMPDPMNYNAPRTVPNYLVQAILGTIFCCLPLGIVSIIYAAQVNGKLAAGDYAGAVQCSNNAKMWCWINFGIGVLWVIFVLAFTILPIIMAAMNRGPNINIR
jgi:hypothetical protein